MKGIGNLTVFILICFSFACCESGQGLKVYDLRCENLNEPLAIAHLAPHFSWKLKTSGKRAQQGYRILVSSDEKMLRRDVGDLWDSGFIEDASSVLMPYQGKPLNVPSLVYWKVKVRDEAGKESAWSPVSRFGVGILHEKEWRADYIGLQSADDASMTHSPLLRKAFDVEGKKGVYLLHVNSLGYHEAYLNGRKVNEDVLSPAVSEMGKRSLSVTYDVTGLIRKGHNELVFWLGQGWYRKGLFWGQVDDGPFVKARLDEMYREDCRPIVCTDDTWLGSESEYSGIGNWFPHRFGGERIDARKATPSLESASLDRKAWRKVTRTTVDNLRINPQMCEPNRIQKVIKPEKITSLGDQSWLLDMGVTLTGWMEIKWPELEEGQEITLVYSDHLNEKGEIAKVEQTDVYIAAGKSGETFRNKFNYHAFRYVKITNLKQQPDLKKITGYLIYPDFAQTSSFVCSDTDMNAIHDMIHYTFQCLTVGGYLVDCPHIERMGYGGDGHASTQTIQEMYNVSPMYYNWMQAWKDCLRPNGSLPHTAPAPYASGGGPYWCAFVIAGSWRTYVNYADDRLIRNYYDMFERWLQFVESHKVDGLLKQWPNEEYRNWYLGDWATPSGVDQTAERSVDLVNNCCISVCYGYMSKIAAVLGRADDVQRYRKERETLNEIIHSVFYDENSHSYGTGTQIDLAYPMLAGATPASLVKSVEEQFEKETARGNGHLRTGLVGVPVVTEWAVKNSKADLVYSMLKKRSYPGYLYMIDNGATTTWEHWNGERSRIHNCYNGIGSWFYEAVGGIRPDEQAPGFQHFYIAPQIPEGMTWARAERISPYGKIGVNWELEGKRLKMELTIPSGSAATIILPDDRTIYTLNGEPGTGNRFRLGAGEHLLFCSDSQ
jgi:alpha-L-rhamnosidase